MAVDLAMSYGVTLLGQGQRGWLTVRKTVAATTVDWWNSVSLLEVKLTKTSPAVALALRDRGWRLRLDVQRYQLSVQEFRGIDRPGRPNSAEVIRERGIGTGLGFRLGLSRVSLRRVARTDLGGYCEVLGRQESRVVLCGLSLNGMALPGL